VVTKVEKERMVREVLERIADKWTLIVIDALADEDAVRFTELRRRIGGISQKMLTKTLRQMERDGLLTRQVYPVVPPHVEYRLTSLGNSLGDAVCGVWEWVEKHMRDLRKARERFEAAKHE
jgi:DNA-binding HxlR family transcriptional regulator